MYSLVSQSEGDFCIFGTTKNKAKSSNDCYMAGGAIMMEFKETKEFQDAAVKFLSIVHKHQSRIYIFRSKT